MKRLLTTLTTLLLTLTVMAQAFDNLPTPGEEKVIDNTPDSIAKALMSRPAPGSTRKSGNPVLFLIGNSTMRNGTLGNGNNGQWGWGYFFNKYFDGRKISVENQALGGMSTRTFYTDLWPAVREALKPGDWVIVSIGHNDHADFFDQRRARGVIDGVDPDTMVVGFNERKQINDTVYSYGTYLRKYVNEIRAKGLPISLPSKACLSSISMKSPVQRSTSSAVGRNNIISLVTIYTPLPLAPNSMRAQQPRVSSTQQIHS